MDEALITIVEGECSQAAGLKAALTLRERLEASFTEARMSCGSMPKDAQFRGAILAVYNLSDSEEKKWIDAELRNIELVARSIRGYAEANIPVLVNPIGLTELWRKSKP